MRAFYNEIDPYAAQWLRNLIAAGLIAPGDVDERSIVDIQPGELARYTQCHFFAGLGGWSHALRLAGWPDDRAVWTGSCPCQPLSSAGQQKGHADERHLWPAFFGLISECKPATVFGEQVASKLGREWLAGVRADMETLGYAIGAADLPACSVGAPHRRNRLWFVADATHQRFDGSGLGRSRGGLNLQTVVANTAQFTERKQKHQIGAVARQDARDDISGSGAGHDESALEYPEGERRGEGRTQHEIRCGGGTASRTGRSGECGE